MLRLMVLADRISRSATGSGGNALIPACERAHVETVKLLLYHRHRRRSRQQPRLDLSARDRHPRRRRPAAHRGGAARARRGREPQHRRQGRRVAAAHAKRKRTARNRATDRRRRRALIANLWFGTIETTRPCASLCFHGAMTLVGAGAVARGILRSSAASRHTRGLAHHFRS